MERSISLADLKDNGACRPSREAFLRLYGEAGNVMTLERVMAGAQEFDWVFAGKNLLTPKQAAHFKNLVISAFRGVARQSDPGQQKRRQALAFAFYQAYNSPTE